MIIYSSRLPIGVTVEQSQETVLIQSGKEVSMIITGNAYLLLPGLLDFHLLMKLVERIIWSIYYESYEKM